MTTTPKTTASGAADFPEFPGHPEPQIMRWSALESEAIRQYGAAMYRAGRLAASAPVAPTQPMPYPTDAQVDAVYEQTMSQHLRSQDAPAVRRFGRAMFLCAWNAAAPKADLVPDAGKMVPASPQQGEYPPLPVPDPHCYDEDTRTDVWSYSASQMHAAIDADRAARGAAQAEGWRKPHRTITYTCPVCAASLERQE